MALTPSVGSASALLRTANSLAVQQADYQDALRAYEYSNSAYTDEAFGSYQSYLNGRITSLNSSGSLSSAQKALSLSRALDSAGKSNISASITRENIQIMSGNATPTDKLNLIRQQYFRAATNGDLTLAQSLMSQAYSLDQSIQLQRQQAADASATLYKASLTASVNKQADIITSLNDGLERLTAATVGKSEADFNKFSAEFVKANAATYSTLGVTFAKGTGDPSTQPNPWDIYKGVMVAKYNAMVLKAQAESAIDPQRASQMANDAYMFANYGTQQTPAGRLTLQQVQEASQSPNMLVYNNATGKYVQSTKTGFQYQTFTGYKTVDGKVTPYTYKAVVPTFSGFAPGNPQASKTYFLTPNQTTLMNKLGLQIEAKVNKDGTVGTGIKAQAMGNTPQWLTKIIGKGGEDQFFNQNGQLQFSSGGKFYTLSQDGRGLIGLTEHNSDGTTKIIGGQYGYNPNPASKGGNGLHGQDDSISSLKGPHMDLMSDFGGVTKLIMQSREQLAAIKAATLAMNQKAAAAMLAYAPPPLPHISVAPPKGISTPTPTANYPVAPRTINPQTPAGVTLQGGVIPTQGGSIDLFKGGGTGIRL